MQATPTRRYPVTAHCSTLTGVPTSSLISGSRIVTAEVLAFTISVEMHATSITPSGVLGTAAAPSAVSTIGRRRYSARRCGSSRRLC